MNESDFPHIGPDFPRTDPEIEPPARAIHRNPQIVLVTAKPHAIGEPRLEKVGFARTPELLVTVNCRRADVGDLIPLVRQRAFAFLAERGISDEHLRFVPRVSFGERRRSFTDQDGVRRFGQEHEIRFDLSKMLADAVAWQGSTGTLIPTWQLAAETVEGA